MSAADSERGSGPDIAADGAAEQIELKFTFEEKPTDGGLTLLRRWDAIGELGAMTLALMRLPTIPGIYQPNQQIAPGGWMPVQLSYHSPRSVLNGHEPRQDCHLLAGDCYSDGTGLGLEELIGRWHESGYDDELIHDFLRVAYVRQFITENADMGLCEALQLVYFALGEPGGLR